MSYLNVKRICRLCCKPNSRMRSLYEQQPDHPLPMRQIIYSIAQLEVDPNDGMPQKVCATCIKTSIRVYETVEIFRANDLRLREQLTRTMQVQIKDILEVNDVSIKQEVLDEGEEVYHESAQQNEQMEVHDVDDTADCKWNSVGQSIELKEVMPPMIVSVYGSHPVETVVKMENVAADTYVVEDSAEGGNHDDDCNDEQQNEQMEVTVYDKANCKWNSVGQSIELNEAIPPMIVSIYGSQPVETVVKMENVTGDAYVVDDSAEGGNYHDDNDGNDVQQNEQMEVTVDDTVDYKWNSIGQNIDLNEVIPSTVVSDAGSQPVKMENVASDDNVVEDSGDGNDGWRSEAQDSTEEQKPLLKKKPKRPRYPTKYENAEKPHLHDYKCYICKSESHGSTEALVTHMNTHLDILPFTCSECTMEKVVYKGILKVNAHLREHLKPEKCPHCDKRCDSKYKIALHVQKQHAPVADYIKLPSKCSYCVLEYPSKVELLQHMKQVHFAEAASCAFCGEIFKERHLLRLHISKSHEPDRKFACDICNREFAAQKNLQNHTNTFHSNETFECSYCKKKFRLKQRLRDHEKKHIENPNYVPMKDWSAYYTVLEGEESKPGDQRRKRCNICGVIGAKWMTGHIQGVHFPGKYDCNVCGWSTKHKENHRKHMRVHELGRTAQCPICERKYPDRQQLIIHLRAKMHRGHPLAESLDWLGYKGQKKQKHLDGDSGSDAQEKAQ